MQSRVYLIDNDDSVLSLRLTEALLRAGHYVVLTRMSIAAHDWQQRFPGHYFNFDFADIQSHLFDMLLAHVVSYTGALDGLICMREAASYQAFEHFSDAQLHQLMARNFFQVARLVRAVLPVMRRQGAGRILNLSSTSSLLAPAYGSGNVASKFALRGLLESVAREVDPFDIKISNVAVEGHHPANIVHSRFSDQLHPDYEQALSLRESGWCGPKNRFRPDYPGIVTDLLALLESEKPPMHLLFGENAYYLLESHVTNMLDNIEHHRALSASA